MLYSESESDFDSDSDFVFLSESESDSVSDSESDSEAKKFFVTEKLAMLVKEFFGVHRIGLKQLSMVTIYGCQRQYLGIFAILVIWIAR